MHNKRIADSWEDIVDAVEAARIRKGVTQAHLAARIGLSQSQYSRVARHRFVPRKPVQQELRSWLAAEGEKEDDQRRELLRLLRSVDALRDEVSLALGNPRRPLGTSAR